jgi:hypothetical protein
MKVAACNNPLPADVFLQTVTNALVKIIEPEPRVINTIQGKDWWASIIAYLCHFYEPDNIVEQTRIQQRAQSYQIVDKDLYKISVSGPLLRCVSKDEGQQILLEIHAGVYGGHIGARALAAKILW